jgi:hypothetical protein
MPLPFQIVLPDDVVIATVNLDNQHLLRARKVYDPWQLSHSRCFGSKCFKSFDENPPVLLIVVLASPLRELVAKRWIGPHHLPEPCSGDVDIPGIITIRQSMDAVDTG